MYIKDIPDPAGPSTSGKTERAADEQGAVERKATPNNVRGYAPEGGAHDQSNE